MILLCRVYRCHYYYSRPSYATASVDLCAYFSCPPKNRIDSTHHHGRVYPVYFCVSNDNGGARKSYRPCVIVSKPVLIYALRHGTSRTGLNSNGYLFFIPPPVGTNSVSRYSKRFPLGGTVCFGYIVF